MMNLGPNVRFDIGFDIKDWFFDKPAIERLMDKVTRKALSRFGAYVRTTAQHSIHKRAGYAPPGQPPFSHTGLLRQNIFFAYDPGAQNVVIGAVLLSGKGMGQAPEILEHGGEEMSERGHWAIETGARGRDESGRFTSAIVDKKWIKPGLKHYEARPYVQPAFEIEKQNLPEIWRQSAA